MDRSWLAIAVVILVYVWLAWSSEGSLGKGLRALGRFVLTFACYAAIVFLVFWGSFSLLPESLAWLVLVGFAALLAWLFYKAGVLGRGGSAHVQEGPGGSAEWQDRGD